jgi:hypothetical protein
VSPFSTSYSTTGYGMKRRCNLDDLTEVSEANHVDSHLPTTIVKRPKWEDLEREDSALNMWSRHFLNEVLGLKDLAEIVVQFNQELLFVRLCELSSDGSYRYNLWMQWSNNEEELRLFQEKYHEMIRNDKTRIDSIDLEHKITLTEFNILKKNSDTFQDQIGYGLVTGRLKLPRKAGTPHQIDWDAVFKHIYIFYSSIERYFDDKYSF